MPYFSPMSMVDTVQEYVFFIIFLQNDLYFIHTEINVKKKMKYTTNGEISNPNQVIRKLPIKNVIDKK